MFDLKALQTAVAAHGAVARVVVAAVRGSAPREVGAAMMVWADGIAGTIGGGALEFAAITTARGLLDKGESQLEHHPLGPKLGQCCGGAVTLLTEVYRPADIKLLMSHDIIARPVQPGAMPLAVKRMLAQARGQGIMPAPVLLQGWMIEPAARPQRQIWIWGAGHVGRALVAVLSPLPGATITWVDVARDRFPTVLPEGVDCLWTPAPEALAKHAPKTAEHLVLTYSHALDLALCHVLLGHGFGRLGLIGSASKWGRFRRRLAALGHHPDRIATINCPIGDTTLGKHPQAIALGVAVALLKRENASQKEIAV